MKYLKCFFQIHTFENRSVKTHAYYWEDDHVPYKIKTKVLRVCKLCGASSVKTLDGKWKLEDLN